MAQSVVRINPGQGQNNQLFEGLLVSVKSIEKVTSKTSKRSRNIVTGGKRRYFASKLLIISIPMMSLCQNSSWDFPCGVPEKRPFQLVIVNRQTDPSSAVCCVSLILTLEQERVSPTDRSISSCEWAKVHVVPRGHRPFWSRSRHMDVLNLVLWWAMGSVLPELRAWTNSMRPSTTVRTDRITASRFSHDGGGLSVDQKNINKSYYFLL